MIREQVSAKTAGIVLLVAASLGVIAISVLSPSSPLTMPSSASTVAAHPANGPDAAGSRAASVWHCASTTSVDARHGDATGHRGWMAGRWTDLRSVRRWRVADTLHVTGVTMPFDPGELSHDFHCRAVVRANAIVNVVAVAGRD